MYISYIHVVGIYHKNVICIYLHVFQIIRISHCIWFYCEYKAEYGIVFRVPVHLGKEIQAVTT